MQQLQITTFLCISAIESFCLHFSACTIGTGILLCIFAYNTFALSQSKYLNDFTFDNSCMYLLHWQLFYWTIKIDNCCMHYCNWLLVSALRAMTTFVFAVANNKMYAIVLISTFSSAIIIANLYCHYCN